MLKYGSLNNVSNQNSKTLLPRNLTYNYALNTSSTNINVINNSSNGTSNSTSQSSINVTDASIDNLNVGTISAQSNKTDPYIVCNGSIAFSLLRAEYIYHNFKIFPLLFTRDMLINNKNLNLNTETLTIKDNVILLNNQVKENSFIDNTSDIFISGFIFPIIDQNSSTGYYSGLLYLPNNKIEKVNSTSSNYKWTNNKYLLFSDTNKGFYKLKYLSQDNSFSSYQNPMTSTYVDLFDNNDNLANLIVNSLGITDGELVAFNNEYLNIMLGNQQNSSINVVTFNKANLTLKNNIDIIFDTSLTIKTLIDYIKFNNSLTTFYTDLFLNNLISNINFVNNLNFKSNDQTYMIFDNINNRIEFKKNVIVDTIIILSDLQLNFKDLYFGSEFNIGSLVNDVFVPYINFINTSTNKSFNLVIDSFANNFNINTKLVFRPSSFCMFYNNLNFNSSIGETYFNLSPTDKTVNFVKKVNVDDLNITTNILLKNDIPIKIQNNFSIVNSSDDDLINFNTNYATFFYNIYLNKNNPKIIFDNERTLEISSLTPNIKLQVKQNNFTIDGPSDNASTTLNVIVGSSLNIKNIGCAYESGLNLFKFVPISKVYVLSGATKPNENITFVFQSIFSRSGENTTQFSGKLNITSRAMDDDFNFINVYDINIWSRPNNTEPNNTVPNYTVEYNTKNPINTNFIGDWSINDFVLTEIKSNIDDYWNISINCKGSPNYNLIWGVKLDALAI